MGRAKIDTDHKLPEKKINSTFNKRKQGAINKAKQLGKLCDCDVALIAFYPKGDGVIDVSHGGSVEDIYRKYCNFKLHHPKSQTSIELRPAQQQQQQNHMNPQPWMHQNGRMHQNGMPMAQPDVNVFHQAQDNNGGLQNILNNLENAQHWASLNDLNQIQAALYQLQTRIMPQVPHFPAPPPPHDFQHNVNIGNLIDGNGPAF